MTESLEGTSTFNLLRKLCGLSQREAADYHDVPVNTVDKWCSGKRTVPPGVLREQRQLYQLIRRAGGALGARMDAMKRDAGETIQIGLAESDGEASACLGFPCIGAHEAAIGVAIMEYRGDATIEIVGAREDVDSAFNYSHAQSEAEALAMFKGRPLKRKKQ